MATRVCPFSGVPRFVRGQVVFFLTNRHRCQASGRRGESDARAAHSAESIVREGGGRYTSDQTHHLECVPCQGGEKQVPQELW